MLGVLMFLATPAAQPDTLTGGQITAWNPNYLNGYPSYVPGLYYWNNSSGDGSQSNIGWCMIGGGTCGMAKAPGPIPFYSVSFTAPSTFYFTSSGLPENLTLRSSVTDQKGVGSPYDVFGYYLANPKGTPLPGSSQVLFSSNDPIGTNSTLNISAGQQYGFFIENIQGPNTPDQTTYWVWDECILERGERLHARGSDTALCGVPDRKQLLYRGEGRRCLSQLLSTGHEPLRFGQPIRLQRHHRADEYRKPGARPFRFTRRWAALPGCARRSATDQGLNVAIRAEAQRLTLR